MDGQPTQKIIYSLKYGPSVRKLKHDWAYIISQEYLTEILNSILSRDEVLKKRTFISIQLESVLVICSPRVIDTMEYDRTLFVQISLCFYFIAFACMAY